MSVKINTEDEDLQNFCRTFLARLRPARSIKTAASTNMAKKGSKLLSALDRHRGRDIKKELVQKQQKEVTKRKQRTKQQKLENDGGKEDKSEDKEVDGKSAAGVAQWAKEDEDAPGWETDDIDEEDTEEGRYGDLSARLDDSDTSSESELDTAGPNPIDGEIEPEEDEEDIPLSDLDSLASEDRGDVVPKQRLTINNTAALTRSLRSIALPLQSLPFSEHQTITNPTPTQITDVEDDLSRELAFYKQSLDSVTSARRLLRAEKQPFSRPADYFAEMVKNDEHMGRVKAKLVDEAAGKKAAAEARKQRDLKKFGKQVQVAKMQERSKEKKDMLEKVNILKRSTLCLSNLTYPPPRAEDAN